MLLLRALTHGKLLQAAAGQELTEVVVGKSWGLL